MEIKLALMCGIDFPIPECQIVMHQPSLKEIGFMGERDFFIAVQTLCVDKKMLSQGKSLLDNTSNFQIFMMIMSEKEARDKKLAVQQVFQLIFPNNKVLITPRSLVLSGGEQSITIDENNFDYLQDILRMVFCSRNGPMDQQAFNPANDKAKEIAQKLMRGRERIAAERGDSNTSIFSQYLSILTVGLASMSIQNLMDLTMFQLYDLIERYGLYVNWDIDIRSRLAGGKPDKSPDNWMKNLH